MWRVFLTSIVWDDPFTMDDLPSRLELVVWEPDVDNAIVLAVEIANNRVGALIAGCSADAVPAIAACYAN